MRLTGRTIAAAGDSNESAVTYAHVACPAELLLCLSPSRSSGSENLLAPLAKTLHIIYQNDTKVSFDVSCPSPSPPPSSFHCIWKQFIILKPPPLLLIHPCKAGRATLLSVSLRRRAFKKSPRGVTESLTDCLLLCLKASQLSFDISLCQPFGVMLKV